MLILKENNQKKIKNGELGRETIFYLVVLKQLEMDIKAEIFRKFYFCICLKNKQNNSKRLLPNFKLF